MQNQQKWYQQPATVVVFLIFFFPVGLYLMWKYDLWSKTARVIVSVFFGLVILMELRKNNSNNSYSETTSSTKEKSYKDCNQSSHEEYVKNNFENKGNQVHGISILQKNGECGFVFVVNGYSEKFGSYTCTVKTEGSNGIQIVDAGCDY